MICNAMLAGKFVEEKVAATLPGYIQPKIDGIRVMFHDGVAYTRSKKKVPNLHMQEIARNNPCLNGLDGELVVGNATDMVNPTKSNKILSAHHARIPDTAVYHAFDYWDRGEDIFHPMCLADLVKMCNKKTDELKVKLVPTSLIFSMKRLYELEDWFVKQGYEGAIYRDVNAPYKSGRSTENQCYLIKIKRFDDMEGLIVGFNELKHNDNEQFTNELGHQSRSSHQENMRESDMLGSFILEVEIDGKKIKSQVGTGLSMDQRMYYWQQRHELMHKPHYVKFKYKGIGEQGAPLYPTFISIREQVDGDLV